MTCTHLEASLLDFVCAYHVGELIPPEELVQSVRAAKIDTGI